MMEAWEMNDYTGLSVEVSGVDGPITIYEYDKNTYERLN